MNRPLIFPKRISSASRWFARLRGESVTPQLEMKFREWLDVDPCRARAYELREAAWDATEELKEDSELQAMLREIDQEFSVSAAGSSVWRGSNTRRWAAAAVCFALAVGGLFLIAQPRGTDFSTGLGEQRTVVLSDGSRMMLNTNTRVTVVYRSDARKVRLHYGEATFAVAHDTTRPFEVSANGGVARAVGTEFNVFRETENSVVVSVLEGRVAVLRPKAIENAVPISVLKVGDAVRYDATSISTIMPADVARIRAWQQHRIEFQAQRLTDLLGDLNRYASEPFELGDPSLADLRVTGVLSTREPSSLVGALEQAFGLRVVRSAHKLILLPPDKTEDRAGALSDPLTR